jgi:glycosyltransferase involved in cell wall biosynthesis
LVTLFFIQDPGTDAGPNANAVRFDSARFPYPANRVLVTNWSTSVSVTGHSGGRVLDEVIRVVNEKTQKKLRPFRHTVSIVVPGLNEVNTVKDVLRDLSLLDFSPLGLGKEIIYVDGGSTDGSRQAAETVPDIKVVALNGTQGRGAAVRLGIEKAGGDIIAFFPSDAEYAPFDLYTVVQAIVKSDFNAVYGSRLIKCVNFSKRIQDIYRGNYLLYLTSKYGGMLISGLSLLLYNRFITDPFSGIKAFDSQVLKDLHLTSDGFEIETELLAKLGQKEQFILEVPVDYRPRTRAQGKKTTVGDGVRAIFKLAISRFY